MSIIQADNGISSGVAGVKFVSNSDGTLILSTANNINALTIDASQFPSATTNGLSKGEIPAEQFYRLNSNLIGISATTAQNALGVGVTLVDNTVYQFEGLYAMKKSTGTTGQVTQWGYGGTATVNHILYMNYRYFSTSGALTDTGTGQSIAFVTTTAPVATMTTSVSTGNQQGYYFRGVVSVATGGTFIPQYTTTGATGPYTMQAGSFFKISPIGAAGANINIGSWA